MLGAFRGPSGSYVKDTESHSHLKSESVSIQLSSQICTVEDVYCSPPVEIPMGTKQATVNRHASTAKVTE